MKSIIFCQAPANITGTLGCCEHELAEGRSVVIIVRNTRNVYLFLQRLNLPAEVLYFGPAGHPYDFRRQRRRAALDIARLGHLNDDDRIFFTDINEDPVMGIYLAMLSRHPLTWISPLTYTAPTDRRGVPVLKRITERLLSLLYGCALRYTFTDRWVLSIDTARLGCRTADFSDTSICGRYAVPCAVEPDRYAILFTEPYRNRFQTEDDYDELNRRTIEALHGMGLLVAAKGHPRIGCHKTTLEMCDLIIPDYLPAEFLDMSRFRLAIGFVSTSLCSASGRIKAYSVLPMCRVSDRREYRYWEDYLQKCGRGRIVMLDDFGRLPRK